MSKMILGCRNCVNNREFDIDKYVKKLNGFYRIERNCQNLGILRFGEIDTSFLYKVNLIKYTSRMTD